jgi:hypothetical protein
MGGDSDHMSILLSTFLKENVLKWLQNKVSRSIRAWNEFTRAHV